MTDRAVAARTERTRSQSDAFAEILTTEMSAPRRTCDLAGVMQRMDVDTATAFRAAMADSAKSAAAIARTLTKVGFPISEGAVRRCRRICDCWRAE